MAQIWLLSKCSLDHRRLKHPFRAKRKKKVCSCKCSLSLLPSIELHVHFVAELGREECQLGLFTLSENHQRQEGLIISYSGLFYTCSSFHGTILLLEKDHQEYVISGWHKSWTQAIGGLHLILRIYILPTIPTLRAVSRTQPWDSKRLLRPSGQYMGLNPVKASI